MKKLKSIAVLLLGIVLGCGGTIAYFIHGRMEDAALTVMIQSEDDLNMLQELKAGGTDRVIARLEARLWDSIEPIHQSRKALAFFASSPDEIENFLADAALQFRGHPVMTNEMVAKGRVLRESLALMTVTSNFNMPSDFFVEHAESQMDQHEATRRIVTVYIEGHASPNNSVEDIGAKRAESSR